MIILLLAAEVVGFLVGAAVMIRRPRMFEDRETPVITALAVASAAAALFADSAPTGSALVDALARALLGGGLVLLGAYAKRGWALLAVTGAALAALESPWQPLAFAIAGLVLASLLLRRPAPLISALAGGVVAQAALTLVRPDTQGVTALVAAAVIAPIALSGRARLPLRGRRLVLRGVGVVLTVCVVGTGVAVASVLLARSSLEAAVANLDGSVVIQQGGGRESTADDLSAAARQFGRARGSLDSWWAQPAGVVPIAAQHWRVLRDAAVTGEEVTITGARAANSDQLGDIRIVDGQVPLDRIKDLEPILVDVAGALEAGVERLEVSRSPWLLPALEDRIDEAWGGLADAERSAGAVLDGLAEITALLGGGERRSFFLAIQTPAENRGSGGFLGNFGEISADDGLLALERLGRNNDLKTEGIPAGQREVQGYPEFMARYGRFLPEQNWGNVNLSPDVPTDAGVMAELYPQSGGQGVDGVITIDPFALEALLEVVGPVEVPGWPAPLTQDNAAQVMLVEQYLRLERPDRIDFLGDVADEVWRRLTTGALPGLPELVRALGPAVRDKHLMFTSFNSAEQRLFENVGASGRMAPVEGDFVSVVTQNAGANKLDSYLHRELDYKVRLDPGTGSLQADLAVVLRNEASPELPVAVIGEAVPPVPPGDNKIYVSMYSPWRLDGATIDGQPVQLEAEDELGRRVYSAFVIVPAQGSTRIELRLSGRLEGDDSYRLDLHRHPAAFPDQVRTSLSLTPGWELDGGAEELSLSTDRTVEASFRRSYRSAWGFPE